MQKLLLIAGLLMASGIAAQAQCFPWFDPLTKQTTCAPTNFPSNVAIGTTLIDPVAGIKAPIFACVGTPGNTTGPYRSLCVTAAAAAYACANSSGCTVAGDWVVIGSSSSMIAAIGTGLQLSTGTLSVDVAVVPTFLTGSQSLTYGSMATGACATAQTFTLTGASTGDSVAPGWPSSLEAGLVGMMRVSAVNTIEVRLCNLSGSTMTPAGGQTFRATIVRSF